VNNRANNCEEWHFLGRGEWERWTAEECRNNDERQAVLDFLSQLEANPLIVSGYSLGPGFPGRFFEILDTCPVAVTWLVAEEICDVTLLRIENLPL
jgi:hypothetical protein